MPSPLPRRLVLLGASLATAVLAASAIAAVGHGQARSTSPEKAAVAVAVPVAQVVGAGAGGRVPWSAPLNVGVADGTLLDVEGTDPDGSPVRGSVGIDGRWTSLGTLLPAAEYPLTAVVRDAGGRTTRVPLVARTSPADRVVHAVLSPGDDAVVGVGMPVVVRLDEPVKDPADRAALVQRLRVQATPAVDGSWRWMSADELHYRPAQFWAPGTRISVVSDLHRLALPSGAWGSGIRTSSFRVGKAVISTVDVTAHTMTVTQGGKVLRVLKASMGKPAFPTIGGTHLVLEKNATRIMDSDTVGLPGEYKTKVDWAVRLTYSGTFTHSAPWSVKDQGLRNVSHGCVNLSPADAKWFYELVRRGDVVQVVNAEVGPRLSDPGSADWNVPYAEWSSP